jgi:hypothetical protein
MATIPREKLSFARPRDESAVVQLMTNTALGMGAGLFMAVSSFTMKYPTISAFSAARAEGEQATGVVNDASNCAALCCWSRLCECRA